MNFLHLNTLEYRKNFAKRYKSCKVELNFYKTYLNKEKNLEFKDQVNED